MPRAPVLKRVLSTLFGLLTLALLLAAWILVPAHLQIRRERPALPTLQDVRQAIAVEGDLPIRLSWIDTSSQATPRSNVLGSGDPHPERPYRLCHSSFVLEWSDGRILLVDTGMTRSQAEDFGALGEWAGAAPIEVRTTVGEALGERAGAVAAVVFTHLHVDHVDGVRELCAAPRRAEISVFMTHAQAGPPNYTTRAALDTVRQLDCLRPVEIDAGIAPLPGFPGVFVFDAGGHTPGSQVVMASVRTPEGPKPVVFSGDIVNNIDGINYDVGKPLAYRLFVVPESETRLGELRRFLRAMRDEAGFEILVSHDEGALQASSVAPYAGAVAGR